MAQVQASSVTKSTGGANNVVTLNGVVAGDLLELKVSWVQTGNSSPPTVSGWSIAENSVGQVLTIGGAWQGSAIFYLENAPAGTNTATIVPAGGTANNAFAAIMAEYVSGKTSGSLDTHTTTLSSGTGTATGSVTNTNAGALVSVVLGISDNTGATHANCGINDPATSGFNSQGVANDTTVTPVTFQASYKYVTSAAAQDGNWTWTDNSAASASIAIFNLAPRIDTQPVQQNVAAGGTATFNVNATTSNGALSYQWRRNATPIGGATSASYAGAATVLATNNGDLFDCDVTDSNGTTRTVAVPLWISVEAPVGMFDPLMRAECWFDELMA